MNYLRVKNWSTFQQYKDRDPKWIKLHRDLLDNYEFDHLDEISQIHLMKIWLLAAKLDNKIPNDPQWIALKISAKSKVNLKQLVTSGFLCLYETVQECTETYLETEERREEIETEGEKKKTVTRKTRLPADWQLTDKLKGYCKTKRPDLNPEETAESFADYWHGDGRTKADWNRVFQTWVRNQRKTNGTENLQSRQRETPVQRSERIEREELAKLGVHI